MCHQQIRHKQTDGYQKECVNHTVYACLRINGKADLNLVDNNVGVVGQRHPLVAGVVEILVVQPERSMGEEEELVVASRLPGFVLDCEMGVGQLVAVHLYHHHSATVIDIVTA